MTRQQLEEKAEQEWRNENPSEIDTDWNQDKITFIKAFMAGFDFAMDSVENQYEEEEGEGIPFCGSDSFGQ